MFGVVIEMYLFDNWCNITYSFSLENLYLNGLLDIMILKVYGKIFKMVRYGFDKVLNVCKDKMMRW